MCLSVSVCVEIQMENNWNSAPNSSEIHQIAHYMVLSETISWVSSKKIIDRHSELWYNWECQDLSIPSNCARGLTGGGIDEANRFKTQIFRVYCDCYVLHGFCHAHTGTSG